MCEPLFRVILKQQFPIMFTVYITQSLLATMKTLLYQKIRCFTAPTRLDEMHPLQSVETERKFKRVIQTERQ